MIAAIFSLSLAGSSAAVSVVGVTIFWRIILGIGIGGDYPTSSIITSEFATVRWRGAMMAAVFSNQGLGQFFAALVSFICTARYKDFLNSTTCDPNCQNALDQSWRILYGLGIVPACLALYFRLTIPETIRYTLDVEVDERAALADAENWLKGEHPSVRRKNKPSKQKRETLPRASIHDFIHHFGSWETGKVLLGTAVSWALLDVAVVNSSQRYCSNLIVWDWIKFVTPSTSNLSRQRQFTIDNLSTVSSRFFQSNVRLHSLGIGNLILSAGGIFGHLVAITIIDRVGRKPLQIGGFAILTTLFLIIGFGWHKISALGLVLLFCLCNCIANIGPNTTTFIVPGEVFPTRYRSTAYGISAASGKIGSIISQALFGPLKNKGGDDQWVNHVIEIYSLFMYFREGFKADMV